MVFSSAVFVFGFLPLVLLLYYGIPARFAMGRNICLTICSLFFYAWGEPTWVVLLVFSAVLDYTCGRVIGKYRGGWQMKAALIASLALNLGLLGTFKYLDFFLQNLGLLMRHDIPLPGLLLPIGISFYTFQTLSYTIDVYRGQVAVQRSFPNFLLFVSLFPQLVAGPIVRYKSIEGEIAKRHIDLAQFSQGVTRFIIGLSKKMLLANPIGAIGTDIFAADALTLTPGMAWLGAVCWSLQVFYDFAGYSDMAIGMGLMLGFHFEENFTYPYIARSITQFWQRWHISLATWFRDYLYIPLGGNRKGKRRQIFNIMLVWGLTGLWHGAAWNFVLWGLYYGVLLVLEKFIWGKAVARLPRVLQHIYTLMLTVFGMVIVNANSLEHIGQYFAAMFGAGSGYYSGTMRLLLDYKVEFFCAVLFAMPVAKIIGERMRKRPATDALRLAGLLAVFVLAAISIVNQSFNPFIYFRF